MSVIALVRMQQGSLVAIIDGEKGDNVIKEYGNVEQAETELEHHILAPLGIQFVDLDHEC